MADPEQPSHHRALSTILGSAAVLASYFRRLAGPGPGDSGPYEFVQ